MKERDREKKVRTLSKSRRKSQNSSIFIRSPTSKRSALLFMVCYTYIHIRRFVSVDFHDRVSLVSQWLFLANMRYYAISCYLFHQQTGNASISSLAGWLVCLFICCLTYLNFYVSTEKRKRKRRTKSKFECYCVGGVRVRR